MSEDGTGRLGLPAVQPEWSSGATFGRLTLTGLTEVRGKHRYVQVSCSCGSGAKYTRFDSLKSGAQVSCGCHRDAQNAVAALTHGHGRAGSARSPIYHTWSDMVQRVTNPKVVAYSCYGGRGITMQDSWKVFVNFLADMGETWFQGAELERLDSNGNYCKDNCTWATRTEQMQNTRRSYLLRYEGATWTVKSLSAHLGISEQALRRKVKLYGSTPIEELVQSILEYRKAVKVDDDTAGVKLTNIHKRYR